VCDGAGDGDTVADAVEGEDSSNWYPRAAEIVATATSTPAARILRARILRARIRWDVVRARVPVTPPVKEAWCCQHVCGFRYADDMRRL
jgi:hypothetical protein